MQQLSKWALRVTVLLPVYLFWSVIVTCKWAWYDDWAWHEAWKHTVD
jgi:hypothetical protein